MNSLMHHFSENRSKRTGSIVDVCEFILSIIQRDVVKPVHGCSRDIETGEQRQSAVHIKVVILRIDYEKDRMEEKKYNTHCQTSAWRRLAETESLSITSRLSGSPGPYSADDRHNASNGCP